MKYKFQEINEKMKTLSITIKSDIIYKKVTGMRLIGLIFSLLFCTMAYAQDDKLPSEINDSLKKKFKNIQNLSWYADNDVYYIDFDQNEDFYKVLYKEDGKWIETCKRIDRKVFPYKIVKVITKKHPSIQLINGDLVKTEKGEKFYRFFGYTAETDYTINVSLEGKILNN